MVFIDYVKIAILVVIALLMLFCMFSALKQGIVPFLGCLFIAIMCFVIGLYIGNKDLVLTYLHIVYEWLATLFK